MITATIAPPSGLGQRAPQPQHVVLLPQAPAAPGVLRHTASATLWRRLPGCPACEVSADGVVRRCQGLRCRSSRFGQRPNNHARNLVWLLHSENERHQDARGPRLRGVPIGKPKLGPAQAVLIRQVLAVGSRPCARAQACGVGDSTVSRIARAKTWRHGR